MTSGVSVELIGVTKWFGSKKLFSGLNCSLGPGECLAVSGKNGSGKSTLLKLIAGVIRPNAGTIRMYMDGRNVAEPDRFRLIGVVSPDVVMYNDLTGTENIRFIAQVRGLALSDAEISRCCELTGLGQSQRRLTKTYSTGMKQRLKLAVLLAVQPALWILDEPESNLDAEGRAIVSEIVQLALGRGATVVVAVNEPREAQYAKQKISLA